MRDKGEKLTGERLAAMDNVQQMIDAILIKAGVVSFWRLMRILTDSCMLAKTPIPDWSDKNLQKLILEKCNVLADGENKFNPILITKTDLYKNTESVALNKMRGFL